MANKRLKDFTAKAVPEGADVVFANNATVDQEVKVPFTGVKSYVLDGKTVGGTAPGDIVNIDSSQTLTNKRLNSPAINSSTPTSATSAELNIMHGATITTAELNIMHGAIITTAELNILHGATITTAELNRLQGITDNIQAQLNALATSAYVTTQRTYTYGTGTITGVSSQIITDAELVNNTGLDSSWWHANPDSITVAIYKLDSTKGVWILQTPTSPLRAEFSTRVIYDTTVLNQVIVLLEEAQTYKIIITYKVKQIAGV